MSEKVFVKQKNVELGEGDNKLNIIVKELTFGELRAFTKHVYVIFSSLAKIQDGDIDESLFDAIVGISDITVEFPDNITIEQLPVEWVVIIAQELVDVNFTQDKQLVFAKFGEKMKKLLPQVETEKETQK